MATYESARLHEVTALPLRTMASPLEVMIEAGDLPVERPGRIQEGMAGTRLRHYKSCRGENPGDDPPRGF